MGMPSIYSIAPLQGQNASPNSSVAHIQRANQADMVSNNEQTQNNLSEEGHCSALASHESATQADQTIEIEENADAVSGPLETIAANHRAVCGAEIELTSIAIEGTSNNRVTIFPIGKESTVKSPIPSSTIQVAPESLAQAPTLIPFRAALHNLTQEAPYEVKAGVFSPNGEWLATRDSADILWLGKVENNPSSMQMVGEVAEGGQIVFSPNGQWIAWRDPVKIVCRAVTEREDAYRTEYLYNGKERFALSDQYLMLPAYYYSIERLQAWEERKKNITTLSNQFTEVEIKYCKVTRARLMAEKATLFFVLACFITPLFAVKDENKSLFALIPSVLSIGILFALIKWQHKLQDKKNILTNEKEELTKQTAEEKQLKNVKIEFSALQSGIATSEIKINLHTDASHKITFSAFSEDKKRFLVIENWHTVKIFCAETGVLQKIYEPDFSDPIISATFSTTGKLLALVSFKKKSVPYDNRNYRVYFYRISIFSLETLQIKSHFDLDRFNDINIPIRDLLLSISNNHESFYRFGPLAFSSNDKWLIAAEDGVYINSGFLYSIESEASHEISSILSRHETIKTFYWPSNDNILCTMNSNHILHKWNTPSEENNLKLELIDQHQRTN